MWARNVGLVAPVIGPMTPWCGASGVQLQRARGGLLESVLAGCAVVGQVASSFQGGDLLT